MAAPAGGKPAASALELETTVDATTTFKQYLAAKGEASPLFGNRRGKGLEAILGNIEQTMFGEPLANRRAPREPVNARPTHAEDFCG